ncbi:MAG: hypothetical protein GX589_07345 [Deltaproteobacteria bacterium]|nr:hypothetical protein [Deltaproteobacteria bacterium]
MDFGFCAFSLELCQTAEDLAPELQQGHPPSHQTDLFGLGLLLKLLLKDLLNPVQTGLLADLVGDLPDARPSAETVRRELFPGLGKKAMRAFPRTLPHIGGVKLGKLLGKNLHVKENETAEEPSEAVKEPENHLHSRSAEETLQWLKGTVALGQEVTQCIREQLNEPDSVASCPPEKIDPCSTPDPHSNESSSTRQRQVTEENLKLHLPEEQKSTDRLSWWFWILLALILVLTVLYKRGLLSSEPEVTLQAPLPYEEFWQSGLTSKMREVVLAAVSGQDPQAELFIVKQALSGKESPHIQHDLIKIAFDPRWEGDLKPVDRQLALKLAMAGLLGRQIGQVPGLNDIHPGVLLAIIANLSLDSSNAEINAISTSQLKVLPPPYGPFFEFLDEIGLKNFASPSARAAAQIIVGRATPQVLSVYFSDEDDAVLSAKKLRLLLAISSHNPTMIENIYRALLSSRNVLRDLLKWFENTKLSHWKDVPVEDRLKLAAGELPGKALKLESYADLLRFPVMAVREAAADTLRRDFFSENMHSTISLLASPRNKLTRYQTIFLVTALGADRDTRYSLLAAWFGTKPNPQSVLDLIILRRNIQVVDPLTIDGVRYLRGLNFSLSRPELLKLLYHFEPLARAWAYSKLEVSNAEDLKLLREALTRETLPVLKQQIRLKLEDLWDETARK